MSSAYRAITGLPGLVAYYPLLQPISRHSLPGLDLRPSPINNSFSAHAAGPIRYAAETFNGTNQFLALPTSIQTASVNGASAVTLLTWAYRTSDGFILHISVGTGLAGPTIYTASGNLTGGGRSGTGDTFQTRTGAAMSSSTWHFLAVVVDFANSQIGTRLNGAATAYTGVTFANATFVSGGGTSVPSIGAFGNSVSSGTSFFGGRIAHAAICTGVVSDAALDDVYGAVLDLDPYLRETGANTASVTLTLKDPASGGAVWASKTGLAVDVSVERDSAPFYSATGQSTNASGELAIAATGCPLAAGTRTVWIRITDSDGLAGGVGNDSNAFYAPVEVTVA